jgi:hypothetical protein
MSASPISDSPSPNSYLVLIPQVAPGTYRITDRIFGPDSTLTASVAVEVRG